MLTLSNINYFLHNLGLNDKEIKIFLTLLQTGPSTVQNLSKATSISRATVYQRLENLKELGLVIFEFGEGGKVVRAVHPKHLREIVHDRVEHTHKLEHALRNVYPELISLFQPKSTKAKILHFEGIQGLQRMIYNYEMEAIDKNLYGYTTTDINRILGHEFIKRYHKKFIEKGYKDHFIMSESAENKEYLNHVKSGRLYIKKRIFVRTLPRDTFHPKVNVTMYDNKYAILLMRAGKPFGVIIENQEVADHQKEIFNILWDLAKSI